VADKRRAARRPREPLPVRRERALARIADERNLIASDWREIEAIVRDRERGALAVAQTLATAVKLGGAAAAIWMAGRIRGPRVVRRGVMLITAARTAGRLFARRRTRG
jgi:hypothetical protein